MHLAFKSALEERSSSADREMSFLVELAPWHKVFFANVRDLFRPDPPPVWITSPPAEYWPDALVDRPPAWNRLRLSFLGHFLVALAIFWINLLWLNHPHIVQQEMPRTTITHYQLSEYLPSVANKQPVPARPKARKADPEYAPQEIVSIHSNPSSLKQTIVHPSPNPLQQDVKLPNLMVRTPIPSAPIASNRPMPSLPMETQPVAPPPEEIVQRRMSQLTFPLAPPLEVAAPAPTIANRRLPTLPTDAPRIAPPASAIASGHRRPLPALPENGPIVIKPSPAVVARDARRISLPAQSPLVAAPAAGIASQREMQAMAMAEPQVAPPSQMTSARNFSRLTGAMPSQAVIPPPQPVSGGLGGTQSQAMGQLLAVNIQPLPPSGPVSLPEGSRNGEFAASPEGKPGASGRPEIKTGNTTSNEAPGNHSARNPNSGNVYIAEPPHNIVADTVFSAPLPTHSRAGDVAMGDRLESQIFGTRRQYSIRLNMPNLNSITGSWIMRFARLNSAPGQAEDISAPEPLSKVDPAYPLSMMQDRVQGTVTLYAIIRSDGTVGDVRILDGFDARLDENARLALEKWRFRPGTRNGTPVDVEAVVRVPFKLAKPAF